jgi:hypothetical protein
MAVVTFFKYVRMCIYLVFSEVCIDTSCGDWYVFILQVGQVWLATLISLFVRKYRSHALR